MCLLATWISSFPKCHFKSSSLGQLTFSYWLRSPLLILDVIVIAKNCFSVAYLSFFVAVYSLSHIWLFVTLWTEACQASLSIINSWSLYKFMSIESVMPPNRLILYCPLLLLPSILPSIRVFSFSNRAFWRAKFLNFYEVQLITFFLL